MGNAHSEEHRIRGRTRPDNGSEAQIGSGKRDIGPQFAPHQSADARPQETSRRTPDNPGDKCDLRSGLGAFPGSTTQRQGVAGATDQCSVQKAGPYSGATAVQESGLPLGLPTGTQLQASYFAIREGMKGPSISHLEALVVHHGHFANRIEARGSDPDAVSDALGGEWLRGEGQACQ